MWTVNEDEIRNQTAIYIRSDAELTDHAAMLDAVIVFISDLIEASIEENESELVVQRLWIRYLNSIIGGYSLIRSGIYQQGMMLIRDIVETTFLLDLFRREPSKILEWTNSTVKDRMKNFSPLRIREQLDCMDSFEGRKREKQYKFLSNFGTHPTPEGFQVFSPNMQSKIGPFADHERFKACMQDLVKHTVYCASIICVACPTKNDDITLVKDNFLECAREWREKYMGK